MKKNFWTKMVSLVLVLVCVVGLAACGGGGDVSGTYKLHSMEMAGMSLDYEQLVATYAAGDEENFAINLVLNADGTYKLDMEAIVPGSKVEGTWKVDGSTLTLTTDGYNEEATIKGGVITLSESGMSMTFKK